MRKGCETESEPTRIRVTTDGRVGWPDVVQYELQSGPDKGKRLTCPPTAASHPDPDTAVPPTIDSWSGAKAWRSWMDRRDAGENMARAGCAYLPIVHDRAAYERLRASGDLYNRRHTGAGQAMDARDAAEA